MIAYDQGKFEQQIKDYLSLYHRETKELVTGNQIIKDSLGDILAIVPYISVKLKDDADILADLSKLKHVRVQH